MRSLIVIFSACRKGNVALVFAVVATILAAPSV